MSKMSYQIKVYFMKILSIFSSIIFLILIVSSCSEKQKVLDVGAHPDVWTDASSEEFHGKAVVESGKESCASCHGTDFEGGTSKVSCKGSGCHTIYPHKAGFSEMSSDDFHGQYIKNALNWNLAPCQTCHGESYDQAINGVSCKTCHTATAGPEACNTCHGSLSNIAPPQDLSNNTQNTAIGVGAHQIHITTSDITQVYSCGMCHTKVNNFDDPNHIDGTGHAEVIFADLATNSGELSSSWDHNNASCSQVYCHGSFAFGSGGQITGNSDPVVWTAVNPDPAACDFCHALPPAGHPGQGIYTTPGSCALCHSSVVNSDGLIINTFLHINGEANF
jgi:hypothetical protein